MSSDSPKSVSLIQSDTTVKVSSTLSKDVGKKNLIDGNPETCWTSLQGLPQHIILSFTQPVIPKTLSLVFQGGFVGTRSSVFLQVPGAEKKEWSLLTDVYPEDVNRRQTFDLTQSDSEKEISSDTLKIVFQESSDFFGRITVYDVELSGVVVGE